MKTANYLIFAFGLIWCVACQPDRSVEDRVRRLEADIKSLETQLFVVERLNKGRDYVSVDPYSKGYQLLNSEHGAYLVIMEGVEESLDSRKLKIGIVNLMSVPFDEFSLKVEYGRSEPPLPRPEELAVATNKLDLFYQWQNETENWRKKLQMRQESFTKPLRPGFITRVDLVLPRTSSENFQYLGLSVNATGPRTPVTE